MMNRINYNMYAFCKDDPSKIENYELAKADNFYGWVVHHRLETKCPIYKPSRNELIEQDLYFHRPAEELIFMKIGDHTKLHKFGANQEIREKISKANKGKKRSEEAKRRVGLASKGRKNMLGKHHSEETKRKISEAHKGKTFSEEHRRKLSEAKKGKHWKLVDSRRVFYE